MKLLFKNQAIIVISILAMVIVGLSVFCFLKNGSNENGENVENKQNSNTTFYKENVVIGSSVEGRDIKAYTFGRGDTHLIFVGGIHGGYEWNSALLAYKFIDYIKENPKILPKELTVSIIPSANPDGLYRVTSKEGSFNISDVATDKDNAEARFNANEVDLNRNFDCKWKKKGIWRDKLIDAGTKAFSEPETKAIRDFVLKNDPAAVVFWHSQSNAVYASKCKNGILPETIEIMNAYSSASGYRPVKTFNAYEVTGDAEGWLASVNIPAITVELKTHKTVEWKNNLAGINALFEYYVQ